MAKIVDNSTSRVEELMTSSSRKGMSTTNHQAMPRTSKPMEHIYNATEPIKPPNPPPIELVPKTDRFWPSFVTAFVMIIASELGDKTFLIAAILAMRHSRLSIFIAGTMALALMTIISCAFGLILPNLVPRRWTVWCVSILFILFGVKMLFEGWKMSATHLREEYDEVAHEIEDSEDISRRRVSPRASSRLELGETDVEGCHRSLNRALRQLLACFNALRISRILSPVVVQAFSLTFLAEWGDRSQIATIALAAAQVHHKNSFCHPHR